MNPSINNAEITIHVDAQMDRIQTNKSDLIIIFDIHKIHGSEKKSLFIITCDNEMEAIGYSLIERIEGVFKTEAAAIEYLRGEGLIDTDKNNQSQVMRFAVRSCRAKSR